MAEIITAKFIWMNGKLVRWNDARVHVMTHALNYGTAVFEGIHSYNTGEGAAIFRLDEHIRRFFYSARSLSMSLNFTKHQLKKAIKKLMKANGLSEAYIRPFAYYGYGNVSVFPRDINSEMTILAIPEYGSYPKNLKVITSKYAKPSQKSTVFGAKISGNYINPIIAMFEARKKGYDEALMLDCEGYVAEGPIQNMFMVKNGAIITPDSRAALLGITRDTIIKIGNSLGFHVYEKKVTLKEAKKADEMFFCGTATEIVPISSVDDVKIGNGNCGEITSILKNKFQEIVRGKDRKYIKWLTYIN